MRVQRVLWIFLLSIVYLSYTSATVNTSFVTKSSGKLKILALFGYMGKSHFDFFSPLLVELARRGHHLTVISHYPRSKEDKAKEPLPNYKDISLLDEKVGLFLNAVDIKQADHSFSRLFSEIRNLRRMASISCEVGLKNQQVHELVKSREKFDVILTENFNTECFMAIVHQFDAPFIAMSSHQIMPWANNRLGNPHEASYIPSIFSGLPKPMNFLERLINVATISITSTAYDIWYHRIDQAMVEEIYGPGVPDISEITKKTTALLVNTHFSLQGSRSQLPNVIEVGGLHIPQKRNPLPKDIAEFLDSAKEGVLYFNLGSVTKASTMPKEKLDAILKVIASIPRKVIWKWEVDSLPYKPSNLMVKKWLPQFDIMGHPNVKCYFGHGGLLGLSEGVYNALPMVLLPIFGDQFYNAATAKSLGIAVILKLNELSEETIRDSLDEAFNNTRYRENVQKLSKAYRDRPANPLETAVWWTEYIARGNGLPYIKSEAANMPWYQRYLIDVVIFLLVVSLVILYAIYRSVVLLLSLFFAEGKSKSNDQRKRSKKKD